MVPPPSLPGPQIARDVFEAGKTRRTRSSPRRWPNLRSTGSTGRASTRSALRAGLYTARCFSTVPLQGSARTWLVSAMEKDPGSFFDVVIATGNRGGGPGSNRWTRFRGRRSQPVPRSTLRPWEGAFSSHSSRPACDSLLIGRALSSLPSLSQARSRRVGTGPPFGRASGLTSVSLRCPTRDDRHACSWRWPWGLIGMIETKIPFRHGG